MNLAGDWTGGLQKPNGLNHPLASSDDGAGYRRCHWRISENAMFTNDEAGVGTPCMERHGPKGSSQSEPGYLCGYGTGCVAQRHADDRIRLDRRPELPGAEPAAYRTTGTSHEHGNLDRSAELAMLGKLPSPAMSPTRGRAFVVVRARESRAQGEGRQ